MAEQITGLYNVQFSLILQRIFFKTLTIQYDSEGAIRFCT
jgi:hypothetical protein